VTSTAGPGQREASFAFHAAPAANEWFNDPNGLLFVDGHYRLYMQHSRAGPDFKQIGWGAMTSDDLLDWRWNGVAIAPGATGSAYSGSVTRVSPVEAFLTRHEAGADGPCQTQWRAVADSGGTLRFGDVQLGPTGRNVRDPFVFWWPATGDWRMLLAEPCDWTDWRDEPPSQLAVWASADRHRWRRVGTIGPCDDGGVMWEVPQLVDFGTVQLLIVSIVDRRNDGADSSVSVVAGHFVGDEFVADAAPSRLDLGPDFYAACVNTVDGWPTANRVLVGWASNWATAREMPWPGEVNGGPISLPRTLAWHDGAVTIAPITAARSRAAYCGRWRPGAALRLEIAGGHAALTVAIDGDGQLTAQRRATQAALAWTCAAAPRLTRDCTVTVFVDAGLSEIFIEPPGLALTVFVPGGKFVAGEEA